MKDTEIINIGGVGYVKNCDDETFYNNLKNGTNYLINTNLLIKY